MNKAELLKTLTVIQGIVTEATDKRICACCKESKPLKEGFYQRSGRNAGSWSSYCKDCHCKRAKQQRLESKEQTL